MMDYSSWDIAINTAESLIRALDIEFHFPSAAGVVLDALIVQLLGDPALQSSIQKI
jgi:hypothetical protein